MKLKEIKKNAHKNVKTHYATYLVLCLAAVLMGSEFSSTLSNVIKLRNDGFEGNTKNVLLFFYGKFEFFC
ncbi:MAG: hypothetical protein ACLTL6_08390 [Holdemanella porci]